MVGLEEKLDGLGLSQYYAILMENGFDDWQTVLDITENDLNDLGFKLSHRRVLQREISKARSASTPGSSHTLPTARIPSAGSPTVKASSSTPRPPAAERRTKRRYRWHPQPDPNAPKRPKTAYVTFADHLRNDPSVARLSFVEIAREVGRQWQLMDSTLKQQWEAQTAAEMQDYEDQMDVYRRTDAYQEYQRYLESFRRAPGKTTRQRLSTHSSSETVPGQERSGSVDSREGGRAYSISSAGEPNEFLHEKCRKALLRAMIELKQLKQDHDGFDPPETEAMPPDDLARAAISALLDGFGPLVYIFSKEQVEELLRVAYDTSSRPDSILLTELCIMSAVGGLFEPGSISAAIVRQLAATALALLEAVILANETYLRIMRILCCFTIYALLQKHLSARYCAAAALAIARWRYPQLGIDGDGIATRESWRKVYRTVVFLECWMSYTLGHSPENIFMHLKYTLDAVAPQDSIDDAIQHQAAQLAVISAELSHAVQQNEQMTAGCMDYIIRRLDEWQHNLPAVFQLMSLVAGGANTLSASQERAMLMVHILYLGGVILLYRRLLVVADLERESDQWTLAIAERDVHKYEAACEMAAQQVARILAVIDLHGYSGSLATRSYWSFCASLVLLYRAAQNIRDGKLLTVDDQLAISTSCIQMLSTCGNEEQDIMKYVATLEPAYSALHTLRQRLEPELEKSKRLSHPKISISALLDLGGLEEPPTPALTPTPQDVRNVSVEAPKIDATLREDASRIIGYMSGLLKDSFGTLQQRDMVDALDSRYSCPALSETFFWFR